LLKTAQLRFTHLRLAKKRIDVVVMKDEAAKHKFESFFGANKINFYGNGLSEYVQKVCT
jgi:hypothetical protein